MPASRWPARTPASPSRNTARSSSATSATISACTAATPAPSRATWPWNRASSPPSGGWATMASSVASCAACARNRPCRTSPRCSRQSAIGSALAPRGSCTAPARSRWTMTAAHMRTTTCSPSVRVICSATAAAWGPSSAAAAAATAPRWMPSTAWHRTTACTAVTATAPIAPAPIRCSTPACRAAGRWGSVGA
ncbi:hypothetical protein D3C72_1769340 [compost metagenome]